MAGCKARRLHHMAWLDRRGSATVPSPARMPGLLEKWPPQAFQRYREWPGGKLRQGGLGRHSRRDRSRGSPEGYSATRLHQPRGNFKTFCAVHQRSPATEGAGRRDTARYLHCRRLGCGARCGARIRPRTGRGGAAGGATDSLPSGNTRRATAGPDDYHHHHVPVSVAIDITSGRPASRPRDKGTVRATRARPGGAPACLSKLDACNLPN